LGERGFLQEASMFCRKHKRNSFGLFNHNWLPCKHTHIHTHTHMQTHMQTHTQTQTKT